MKRITIKFADKVVLPMMPISPYYDLSELDKFHEARRKYEEFAIRLSEYEDIGTVEEFRELKETDEEEDYNCICKEKYCVYNDGSHECHYEGIIPRNDNGDCLKRKLL